MNRRVASVMVGLAVYIALVCVLYVLHRLAVPGPGQLYPLWYSGAELLLKAATAVGPGVAAGWMFRRRAFTSGAIVGATGGVVEVVALAALGGVDFGQFGSRIAVGAVATAIASALTNSAGSVAGDFLRARMDSSNPPPQTDPRRRRRTHRTSAA